MLDEFWVIFGVFFNRFVIILKFFGTHGAILGQFRDILWQRFAIWGSREVREAENILFFLIISDVTLDNLV